jgi:hypothetical protein
MPALRITVENAPKSWAAYDEICLKLQTKKTFLDPLRSEGDSLQFEAQFEIRDNKPKGEVVWDHGDKRKFIYLTWFGTNSTGTQSFRRIKLYFTQMEPWNEGVEIRINGVLKDGTPACSTARVLA